MLITPTFAPVAACLVPYLPFLSISRFLLFSFCIYRCLWTVCPRFYHSLLFLLRLVVYCLSKKCLVSYYICKMGNYFLDIEYSVTVIHTRLRDILITLQRERRRQIQIVRELLGAQCLMCKRQSVTHSLSQGCNLNYILTYN